MRLSEAIRLGSMMKPQAYNGSRSDGKTCALEAAADAVGMIQWNESWALRQFPIIAQRVSCPKCGCDDIYLTWAIALHLNDSHRWTRERIADWVESIEKQQEAVQPVPTSCWECSERIEDGVHDCPLKGVV